MQKEEFIYFYIYLNDVLSTDIFLLPLVYGCKVICGCLDIHM